MGVPLSDVRANEQNSLRIITSGGLASTVDFLETEFESKYNMKILVSYGSSSGGAIDSIPSRLERNEYFDVIILARYSLDDLTAKGFVLPGSRVDLAESLIGMAIAKGKPVPDISTPEAFLSVVKTANSIGYSASASGTYLSTDLFPRLGLWDEIKDKSRRILSVRVASLVASDEVEIGFQQISEILPFEGVQLVGPIPDEYQKVTTFSAGILTTSTKQQEAATWLKFLASPEAAKQIQAAGLFPVNDPLR